MLLDQSSYLTVPPRLLELPGLIKENTQVDLGASRSSFINAEVLHESLLLVDLDM